MRRPKAEGCLGLEVLGLESQPELRSEEEGENPRGGGGGEERREQRETDAQTDSRRQGCG